MARILSHPFRLAGSVVATVEQSSDEAHAEQIAVLALTKRGERQMVPTFGVDDPTFHALDAGDLATGVEIFGPPVTIMDVTTRYLSDVRAETVIEYG